MPRCGGSHWRSWARWMTKPKRQSRRLKVVRLRKPKIDPDSEFIRTLVWALDLARQGKVYGYAGVFYVEEDDGSEAVVEIADVMDKCDRLKMLGAIRRMEHNFIKREYGEED